MHDLFRPLDALVKALAPAPLYAVGGVVREVVLGRPLENIEIDLCTPLAPEAIMAAAQKAGLSIGTAGLKWGCVQLNGLDVTSFRTEIYEGGSRFPKVTFVASLYEDAKRRDFTCNALYMDKEGAVTDLFGGAAHLKQGRVVWIGNPAVRLAQDPLRWWRWLRFCARYGVAGLENPAWIDEEGQEQKMALESLMEVAAAGQGSLTDTKRKADKAKFAEAPFAEAVHKLMQEALAKSPRYAAKLAL